MAVAGRKAVAVVDFDHAAVAARPSRRDHLAVGGGAHGITHRGAEIEPGVHRRTAEERVAADAEAGGELDLADHRLAIWHQRQRTAEALGLSASDIDPVELAFE